MDFKIFFKAFGAAILQFICIYFACWSASAIFGTQLTYINYVCTCVFVLTINYFYDGFEKKQNNNTDRL